VADAVIEADTPEVHATHCAVVPQGEKCPIPAYAEAIANQPFRIRAFTRMT
jgi:hypothetical protein